jgi:hypothetical protein
LGGTSLADVLATRLRISKGEARRRIKLAALLGPRRAITGVPLPPKLPNVAAAQQRGDIGAERVKVLEKFFDELPTWVDAQTRDTAEADLARVATGLGPTQFRAAADRLALLALRLPFQHPRRYPVRDGFAPGAVRDVVGDQPPPIALLADCPVREAALDDGVHL